MSLDNYLIFLAASFLLWLTPGQDNLYIIARSITQGRSAGMVSALGIGAGSVFHAGLAVAGISVIILTSPVLFLGVKIMGGCYLIYLGISALVSRNAGEKPSVGQASLRTIFIQGIVSNVLNPKVALFFIAFLPQFADHANPTASLVILAFTFVIGGTLWCLLVACFAASFAALFNSRRHIRQWFNRLSAALYISLGLSILRARV